VKKQGADNLEVLGTTLGLTAHEIDRLTAAGILLGTPPHVRPEPSGDS
jgi:hypothetical protein